MTQNSHSTFIPFPGTNADSAQRPGGGEPLGGGGAGAAYEPAEAEAVAGGGGARRGRPSTYHPRIIEMLCQAIRQLGLSDSAAAEQQGMSTTTLSRWKQVHPEVGLQLQQARQEIRVLHLQKIMESASAENGKGWRASAWILERLFPEDYARKISDRFEALNLIEFRKDKERRAVQDEDEKKRQETQRAEAAEARAAAAASAERVDATPRVCGDSRRNAEAPNSEAAPVAACIYSKDDSHNSRNSGGVEVPGRCPGSAPTEFSPRPSPPPRVHVPPARRCAPSAEAAPVASCIYSESASHNSRNSGDRAEVLASAESVDATPRVCGDSGRDAEAPNLEAAPVAACIYSEGDSHNSRNAGGAKLAAGSTQDSAYQTKESVRPHPVDPDGEAALSFRHSSCAR